MPNVNLSEDIGKAVTKLDKFPHCLQFDFSDFWLKLSEKP